MVELEQLEKGILVEGIEPNGPVKIVDAEPISDNAAEVVYKRVSDDKVGMTLLYRSNQAALRLVSQERLRGFTVSGEEFRLATEAYRLKMAYLSDPLIAVHTSLIEPLPHQISAVYEHMLTRQPLRFLLADDPGAGKTIMAGLLMKELVARGDLERCLICCPGGLVEQWQDELWQKFGLPFEIIGREQIEASRTGNPFSEKDLVIGRLDHMSRNDVVKEGLKSTEWDLIVVDEAHKMSASFSGGEIDKTKRYQLGELLSTLTRHLLLMSATPHNGKEEDFQLFLKLLDADRFEGRFRDGVHQVDTSDLMRRMVKEDLKRFDDTFLFPPRRAHTVGYELSPHEAELYEEVTAYVREQFNRAEATEGRVRTVGFALTILQRRMASSPEAIYKSLVRRRQRLQQRLKEVRAAGGLKGNKLDRLADKLEDFDEVPGDELEETEEEVMDAATAARNARELEAEIMTLERLEQRAERARTSGRDRKWDRLRELLEDEDLMRDGEGHRRKLIIFTEHKDTLEYLCRRLTELLGREEAVIRISGGMGRDARRAAQERFLNNPETTVLVATDAAGEGVNLQRANLMVNYDLPWNPNRLEQRFGRIHRIGQTEVCHLWNLVAEGTREGDVYARLLGKLETERKALGGRVFDVLGDLFREKSLRELLIEAIREGGGTGGASRKVTSAIDSAMEHERLRSLIEDTALTHEAMDPSLIRRIRDEMERAEARRLQPHFIESFFGEAYRRLGGKLKEREPGRYELPRMPEILYKKARALPGGARISDAYQRVTFDKTLVKQAGKPLAKFLYPGHPLLEMVINETLERNRNALAEGAILLDENDLGTEPRALVLLEHALHEGGSDSDGARTIASRRMQFVEVRADGTTVSAGHAPHLDYRPLTEDERARLGTLESFGNSSEEKARRWAASELVPAHLNEVAAQRKERIRKTRQAVWERLTKEISYWDRRSAELRQQERETWIPQNQYNKWKRYGKIPKAFRDSQAGDRLNSENAARRRDDLISRRDHRIERLEQEQHLMPGSPVIVGTALIVPAGRLATPQVNGAPGTFARDPEAIRYVEEQGMQAIFKAELELGHRPRDVSAENLGYDIESRDAETGRLRMIEVKGRVAGARTVTVTRNEILTAMNRPDDFILAIVEVEDRAAGRPRYIRRPFKREPDFDATSVNYELSELLERAEQPR